jgi:hypothetical protein
MRTVVDLSSTVVSSPSRSRIRKIRLRGSHLIPAVGDRRKKNKWYRKRITGADKVLSSDVLKQSNPSEVMTSTPRNKTVQSPRVNSSPIKRLQKPVVRSLSSDLSTRKSSRSLKSPRRFLEGGWVYPRLDLRKNNKLRSPPLDHSSSYSNDDSRSTSHISGNTPATNKQEEAADSKSRERGVSLLSGSSLESPDKMRKQHNSDSSNHSSHCHSRSDLNESESARKIRKRKRKTILDHLADTDGYVAEKNMEKTSSSLLVDPSLLSREERALQVGCVHYFYISRVSFYSESRWLQLTMQHTYVL